MKKKMLLYFGLIWISFGIISVSSANSAEPPSIIVIVPNAKEDLELHLNINGETVESFSDRSLFEKQYKFYPYDITDLKSKLNNELIEIVAINDGTEGRYTIAAPALYYNNFYTLDLEAGTIITGKTISRAITLVSLRVLLTLIIEGAIFYLFGYRKKRSWLVFLTINLLTQTALNIYINSYMSIVGYYIISIFIVEIYILIVELIGFNLFLKEGVKIKTSVYVIVANVMSFILGAYILMALPI